MKIDEIELIKENDFEISENQSILELTPKLIEALGSPVSDIREGSLDILYTWIFTEKYENSFLITMGEKLIQNLQTGLEKINHDSVFSRAFSALILAAIIDYDQKKFTGEIKGEPFLSEETVLDWFVKSKHYYLHEKDIRGFVKDKGWAHSIAHGADLFRDFARHRFIQNNQLQELLGIMAKRITSPVPNIYSYLEDKRMALTTYTAFLRPAVSLDLIRSFFDQVYQPYSEERWYVYAQKEETKNGIGNMRLFLQSLYFMVHFGISTNGMKNIKYYKEKNLDHKKEIINLIENILQKLDHGVFYQS